MRVGIWYFTGTGTTAFLAREIAFGLRDENHVVHLARLRDLPGKLPVEYDVVGFGCPTYAYRAPRYVSRVLRRLESFAAPFFLFCTCGGVPGNTLWSLYKTLRARAGPYLGGIVGHGANNLRLWQPEVSATPTATPYQTGIAPRDVAAARAFGTHLEDAWTAAASAKEPSGSLPGPPPRSLKLSLWSALLTYSWQMALYEGRRRVDQAACTSCRACAELICPVGAINFPQGATYPRIRWRRCVGCSGCLNLCPAGAIYSKRTRARHQYLKYADLVLHPPT